MTSLRSIARSPLCWGTVAIGWLLVLILAFVPSLLFAVVGMIYVALVWTVLVAIAHTVEYLTRSATEKGSIRNIVRDWRWWVVVFVMWMVGSLGILDLGLLIALWLTILVIVMKVVERLTRSAQLAQKKQHATRKSVR